MDFLYEKQRAISINFFSKPFAYANAFEFICYKMNILTRFHSVFYAFKRFYMVLNIKYGIWMVKIGKITLSIGSERAMQRAHTFGKKLRCKN